MISGGKMNYNNELENKIFRIILIGTLALSVISIIGNILFGFPFLADIKWFVLIGIAGYLLLKKERAANNIYKIIYFAFIIFVLIPVGWINSGGNANNTIGYIFLTLIAVNYMFYKNTRNFFIISLISIFVLIQIIGRIYPSIIPVYSYDTQFMDRLIQIPLTLFASYVMIKKFADEYRNEKENLEKTNRKLKYYAERDTITGLYNRRYYDENLNQKIQDNFFAGNISYSVLFDIDGFKKVNDTKGHYFGDEVIKEVGKITNRLFPENSCNARWGGDEFIVLYTGIKENLDIRIDKIREHMKKFGESNSINITLSFGITQIKNNDTTESVLQRTDNALYKAKENGKNKSFFI